MILSHWNDVYNNVKIIGIQSIRIWVETLFSFNRSSTLLNRCCLLFFLLNAFSSFSLFLFFILLSFLFFLFLLPFAPATRMEALRNWIALPLHQIINKLSLILIGLNLRMIIDNFKLLLWKFFFFLSLFFDRFFMSVLNSFVQSLIFFNKFRLLFLFFKIFIQIILPPSIKILRTFIIPPFV
jgi:hypothetical protein